MRRLRDKTRLSILVGSFALVSALVLSGCSGPESSGSTATATDVAQTSSSAAPTAVIRIATSTAEVNTEPITIVTPYTPATDSDAATPMASSVNTVSPTLVLTPISSRSADTVATPVITRPIGGRQRTGKETYTNPGDGTGGSGMPGERSSNLPESETTTAAATPSAIPASQLKVVGCELADVPAYTGDVTKFRLTAEVNFRSGPGVQCVPLREEPLAEGLEVTVEAGPVTQVQDDSTWVQISVDGETGWISVEFIEPAD